MDRAGRLLAEGEYISPPFGDHGQVEAGEDVGGCVVKRLLTRSFDKRGLARSRS